MSDYFGKDVPKLGFGLMRLPKKGVAKDIEQFKTMVDMFLDAGFTYFDTAYVYTGSEAATKKSACGQISERRLYALLQAERASVQFY